MVRHFLNIIFLSLFLLNVTLFDTLHFAELRFLHREIGLLRSENQDHKEEIALLKETVGFQSNKTIPEQIVSLIKKELDEQKKKESLIPISADGNQNPSQDKVNSRNKRPYRLIPVNKVVDFNNEGNDEAISKFYGPPTNCSDLSRLGYVYTLYLY